MGVGVGNLWDNSQIERKASRTGGLVTRIEQLMLLKHSLFVFIIC